MAQQIRRNGTTGVRRAAKAACRGQRLSSNVRRHKSPSACVHSPRYWQSVLALGTAHAYMPGS